LAITPKLRHWWTGIGENSLTVYLLHAPILLLFRYSDAGETIGNGGTVLLVLGSIVLTLLLSRRWVVKPASWLTNPPVGSWLVQGLQKDTRKRGASAHARSEEHTSELQSRFDLVCRLLLEKKKREANM